MDNSYLLSSVDGYRDIFISVDIPLLRYSPALFGIIIEEIVIFAAL